MSSSRISHRSASDISGWNTSGVVVWVLVWAALAVIVHLVYLFVVFPTIDRDIVFFLAGKNGVGGVSVVIDAYPAAVVSTIVLVVGVIGAVVAFAMNRALRPGAHTVAVRQARRKAAHTVAVLALALIAGSLALTAGGIVAAVIGEPITEPGLAGGLPGLVAGAVFISQLVPLLAGKKGRRAAS
ncbi:hypothetical protein ABIE21_003596 [Conyzicola nivalis]|uniref:Integral membrane protein n=1 Tax=Conyzicola nivalis TaxID=1477021 RepID=A0ABV2QT82_9MICO